VKASKSSKPAISRAGKQAGGACPAAGTAYHSAPYFRKKEAFLSISHSEYARLGFINRLG